MRKFLKTLFPAILLPALSYAQSNYKPGYVVDLKGDTLKGFIDYKEWNSNPEAIDFKTVATARDSKRFTPADISYFNITGLESYVRYSGPISMDATDKDRLSTYRDTSYREAVVFLKVLQKGNNLVLYSYTDNLKYRFYEGESPDFKPVELVFRFYKVYGTVNESENGYMKQLFALANKYGVLNDGLQWDIEHTGYNSDGLFKIVGQINHMSKKELKKKNNGPIFNIFVGAGMNLTRFTPQTTGAFYAGGGRAATSYGAAGSIGANLFVNPSTRKFQLRFEAGFAQSQYKSLYALQVYPYIPFKASFDELAINLSPQIVYNFYNTENFKFYGGAGLVFSLFRYSNSYLGSQSQPNSAADIQANNPYFFNPSDNAILFKAGLQIHKNWGIFAQYLTSVVPTESPYFLMSSKSEQVGLNYYFW